jgi:geranylgeranylglycerol-phosphate geranylgeranyltransferase
LGNVAVATLAGLAFLFGAIVQGETFASILPQAWVAFGFAFLWHLAREWVKAAEDLDGDKAAGLNTLAVAYGNKPATRAAAVVLSLLTVGLWPPYFLDYFSGVYLLLVAFGVLPVLVGTIPMLWSGADSARLGQLSRILKWDMLVGVCAIWFGA